MYLDIVHAIICILFYLTLINGGDHSLAHWHQHHKWVWADNRTVYYLVQWANTILNWTPVGQTKADLPMQKMTWQQHSAMLKFNRRL